MDIWIQLRNEGLLVVDENGESKKLEQVGACKQPGELFCRRS